MAAPRADQTATDAVAACHSLGDLDEQAHVEAPAGALHTRAAAASHVAGATDRITEAVDASAEPRRAGRSAQGPQRSGAATKRP